MDLAEPLIGLRTLIIPFLQQMFAAKPDTHADHGHNEEEGHHEGHEGDEEAGSTKGEGDEEEGSLKHPVP